MLPDLKTLGHPFPDYLVTIFFPDARKPLSPELSLNYRF